MFKPNKQKNHPNTQHNNIDMLLMKTVQSIQLTGNFTGIFNITLIFEGDEYYYSRT